jgi:hypothetical protein
MAQSYTQTVTNTYSAARVAYVMDKVQDDLFNVSMRGFISAETANGWREEVAAVLDLQAVAFFELQFTKPNGLRCALRYTVQSNGLVVEDRPSGGFDPYLLPDGTKAGITIRLVAEPAARRQKGIDYLKSRGWSFNGSMVDGEAIDDRAYSKGGYGVRRGRVGDWS